MEEHNDTPFTDERPARDPRCRHGHAGFPHREGFEGRRGHGPHHRRHVQRAFERGFEAGFTAAKRLGDAA